MLQFTLSLMFSGMELRHYLGLHEDRSAAFRTSVLHFVGVKGKKESEAKEAAEKQYEALISQITSSLENEQKCFEDNQVRLHDKEKAMRQNRMQQKRNWLSALSKAKPRYIQ